jgi:hypothetical protein
MQMGRRASKNIPLLIQWTDLRRNRIEADWIDVKYMTSEIDHVLGRFRHWMKRYGEHAPRVSAISHPSALRSSRSRTDHRDMELSGDANVVAVGCRDSA